MSNIAILNTEAHRNLRVQPTGDEAKNFVAVIIAEFPHLVVHYPILFTKNAETGALYAGALLGFEQGENLFLDEGLDIYRPLDLQRGPFVAVGGDLGIDLSSPRVGSGQRLFSDGGEPTAYLKSIMGLFRDVIPGLERSTVFISALLEHKLIEPIDITLNFDDKPRILEGLYTINHEALRALPENVVFDFFKRGYLQLIYLMIASLKQIPVMAQKKNSRLIKRAAGALG